MVKLAFETDQSASCRLLRHVRVTSSFDKVWRAMLFSLSRQADHDGDESASDVVVHGMVR